MNSYGGRRRILAAACVGASFGCSSSRDVGTSPLQFSHVSRVEGRVLNASGEGVPSVSVQFRIDSARRVYDYSSPPALTGPSGGYELVVGRYVVSSPLPALDTVSGYLYFVGTGSTLPRRPNGAFYEDSARVTLRFWTTSEPDVITRRVDTLRIP